VTDTKILFLDEKGRMEESVGKTKILNFSGRRLVPVFRIHHNWDRSAINDLTVPRTGSLQ
jgi:hypothetical protein